MKSTTLVKDSMKKDIIENYLFRIIISAILFLIIGIIFILSSTQCENEVVKALYSTLGAAFVISGVYSVLYEAIIRKGMIATVVEKVNLKRSIDETGLKEIYLRIDDIPYRSMIESSKSKIIIMHSYGKNWTINNIGYIKDICTKKKIVVKVMLLNPESSFCDSLNSHYNNTREAMKARIQEMTDKWLQLKKDLSTGSSVEVYYFDGNPTHSIYVFDNEMVIIPSTVTNDFTYEIPNIRCQKDDRNNRSLYTAYASELENLEKTAKRII